MRYGFMSLFLGNIFEGTEYTHFLQKAKADKSVQKSGLTNNQGKQVVQSQSMATVTSPFELYHVG